MGWNSSSRAAVLALVAAGLLAACDAGPSAVPARDHSQAAVDRAAAAARANLDAGETRQSAQAQFDERPEAPLYKGKPMWSVSRKYTAEENAEYHFKRNGDAFGAKDIDSFVAKAHAFVSDPPRGALTLKRANGDLLIYDPKDNVFAVATRDGAPRTMFRPDDGMAYWEKQKTREAQSASRASSRDRQEG
jgi:hypothetical protein